MSRFTNHLRTASTVALATATLLGLAAPALAAPGDVTWLSKKGDGSPGPGTAFAAMVSGDGRWAAFSTAAQLTTDDTNAVRDVYLRDLQMGALTLVSKGPAGVGNLASDSSGAGAGMRIDLSVDGRYVVFDTDATNLVAGVTDANNGRDVIRYDRVTGLNQYVSVKADGTPGTGEGAHLAGDGARVVFQSSAKLTDIDPGASTPQVYVRDLVTGVTQFASVNAAGVLPAVGDLNGNKFSERVDISADGRYIIFASDAQDIVAGTANDARDIFRRDLLTGTTIVVSVANDGTPSPKSAQGATISGDGSKIAFTTVAVLNVADTNAVDDAYVRDVTAGTTTLASLKNDGGVIATQSLMPAEGATIDASGTRVLFENIGDGIAGGDANARTDAFVRNLATGTTTLATPNGPVALDAGFASLNGDGSRVGFVTARKLDAADANALDDAYATELTSRNDVTAPAITIAGATATIAADPSGIALVTVAGTAVRPDAGGTVAVAPEQTVSVTDGSGNTATATAPVAPPPPPPPPPPPTTKAKATTVRIAYVKKSGRLAVAYSLDKAAQTKVVLKNRKGTAVVVATSFVSKQAGRRTTSVVRRLKPGYYTVVVVVKSAAGQTTASRRILIRP